MAEIEQKLFSSANHYINIMRLDRPIGIYLLLWPTLWSLWLASGSWPPLKLLLVFVVGTVVMRSAGCVMNDIADRNIDPFVERTKNRPLAMGGMTVKQAWILFVSLIVVAFFLVLQLNTKSIVFAFGGLWLTVLYPFCKRLFVAPQLILGLAFSWGIPMVFAATNTDFDLAFYLLWLSTALWIVLYDTFYAMVDQEDDVRLGVYSTAILFGSHTRLITGFMQIILLFLLVLVGYLFDLGDLFFFSVTPVAILFLRQQHLIRNNDPEACLKAFLENNYVGGIIFFGIAASIL
ncbi:MAG: 4-hydroxybenzoate octaprenyltransferase [Gammaproteobacteria bacterium]|nr:4-hydroxybenzoate octaprenyltransferase [Gammaproteobacteria bacterium]